MKKRLLYSFIVVIFAVFCLNLAIFADDYYNLTILETNDTHAHLEPFKYRNSENLSGGIASRATLIKSIRAKNKNILLLDAGDFSQGTLYYNLYKGYPDLDIMKTIGYDAIELGNHEFDEGSAKLEKLIQSTTTPILCSNIKFKNSEYLNTRVKPYIIKDVNGLKVGIIGVITNNLHNVTANADDTSVYNNIYVVNKLVQELKPKTDVIIVLSHSGYQSDLTMARKISGIDVIAGGHSHTKLNTSRKIDNTLIIQTGEFGLNLGELDLNIKNHTISAYKYKLIPVNPSIYEDNEIKAKITELAYAVNKLKTTPIGEFLTPLELDDLKVEVRNTNISTLVGDAIRAKFPDISLVVINSGSFRISRDMTGKVTKADFMELLPFDNKIVTAKISGYDLKRILEKSARLLPEKKKSFLQTYGIDYNVNLNKYYPNRISALKIGNVPVEPNKYYTIAINDFLLKGGDGYSEFRLLKDKSVSDIVLRDAIIDYVLAKKQLNLKMMDNIKYINDEVK